MLEKLPFRIAGVTSYCEQYGLTPYGFESYLQERHKLSDAFSAAKQRLSELLYAAEGSAMKARSTQAEAAQVGGATGKGAFDTVEINDSGRKDIR